MLCQGITVEWGEINFVGWESTTKFKFSHELEYVEHFWIFECTVWLIFTPQGWYSPQPTVKCCQQWLGEGGNFGSASTLNYANAPTNIWNLHQCVSWVNYKLVDTTTSCLWEVSYTAIKGEKIFIIMKIIVKIVKL